MLTMLTMQQCLQEFFLQKPPRPVYMSMCLGNGS